MLEIDEHPSDEDLVHRFARDGDRAAFEELIRRHERRVYGLAYRILGSRADALDAAQEALILVFRKARTFKGQSSFATWLYRLTVNACYDQARAKARAPVPVELTEQPAASDVSRVEDRLLVEQALAQLAPDHRAAVVLREINGLSYEEIAQVLDVPLGTVKSRIARARSALAGRLEGREEPPASAGRLRGEEK